jgi:toxin FitB
MVELFAGPTDPAWDRAVLDTSVVIATDIAPLEGELAISAITLAELHLGVLVETQRKVRAERLRRLLVLQRTFDALPVDEAVAASYGQVAAAVVDAGRQPGARHMWISWGSPDQWPLIHDCRGYGADAHLLVTAVVMPLPALLAVLDHLARCWIVWAPRTLGRPQRHPVDDSVA